LTHPKRAAIALGALMLFSLACSFTSLIEGFVVVPSAVEELFTPEEPGLILIQGDSGYSGDVQTVGRLVGANLNRPAMAIPFRYSETNRCSQTITAWVETSDGEVIARATAAAFADHLCDYPRQVEVELILQLIEVEQ
jgi:hypothetical protein